MHPQYIRAPSKNLAPHLWRLHHLKIKMIRIINGEAEREEAQRRGEGKRRARGAGWTPSRQGARGVSGPPRAIAARPRPAIFGDGSREHLRASPREAARGGDRSPSGAAPPRENPLASRRRGTSPGADTPPRARLQDLHPPEAPRPPRVPGGVGGGATLARPGRGIPATRTTMCPTPGPFHIDRTKQQNEP